MWLIYIDDKVMECAWVSFNLSNDSRHQGMCRWIHCMKGLQVCICSISAKIGYVKEGGNIVMCGWDGSFRKGSRCIAETKGDLPR